MDSPARNEHLSATTPAGAASGPRDPTTPPALPGEGLGERWRAQFGDDAQLPMGSRFEVQEMLGTGSHGQVVAVRDRTLDRRIAVKLFGTGVDAERARSAVAEARMLARMDHPNVLPVYDLGLAQDGQPFVAMKAIEGQTLGAAITAAAEGRASPVAEVHAIVAIGIQICQAVGYAHHRGVIHQDLKPDNIMLGGFGEVLVMDWGCAAEVDAEGTAIGPVYGTPLYMSPEQARDHRATRAADVYAIGATLFHALLRRPPLWHGDADVFWRAKRAGEIQEPTVAERERLPSALLAVVRKALEADPGRRYSSVDALREDLERYQAGLAVAAHPDSIWAFAARAYRRHRGLTWAVAAALVLAAFTGALAWRHHQLEQTSWRLVAAEEFDRPAAAIARDWMVVRRDLGMRGLSPAHQVPFGPDSWQPEGGGIRVHEVGSALDLVWRHVVPGALRVSWEYWTHDEPGNLNCFLGSDRVSGYTFHVGGWDRRDLVVLTRGPSYTRLAWAKIQPIAVNVPHHFVLERTATHIALAIDGVTIIDYASLGAMDAPDRDTFGFDTFHNALTVRHVRIEAQAPARLLSPVAVPDALYRIASYGPALTQYEAISDAYPNTDLADRAAFGAAMCRSAVGEGAAAEAALAGFVARRPWHPYAPFADWERLRIATRSQDEPRAQAVLADLTRFRGSQLLMAILADRSELLAARLLPHGTDCEVDPVSQARVRELEHAILDLRRWSDAYGVDIQGTRLISDGEERLLRLGDAPFVLAHSHPGHARDYARYALGRFQDIIADPASEAGEVARVLMESGHPEDPRAAAVLKQDGLLGWESAMLTLFAHYQQPGTPAQQAYLGHRTDETLRASLAAVAHPKPDWRLGDALGGYPKLLIAAGEEDRALAAAAEYQIVGWTVCLRRLWRADADADTLLARMAACPWDSDGELDSPNNIGGLAIVESLVPVLRAMDRQQAIDVRASLEASLPLLDRIACRQGAYVVRSILGVCSDAEFRSQPEQVLLDERLRLAQGVRAELAHDRMAAITAYQQIAPGTEPPSLVKTLAQWRRTVLGDPTALPPPPRH